MQTDLLDSPQREPPHSLSQPLPVHSLVHVGHQGPDPAIKGHDCQVGVVLLQGVEDELLTMRGEKVIAIQQIHRLGICPTKDAGRCLSQSEAACKRLEDDCALKAIGCPLLCHSESSLQSWPHPLILLLHMWSCLTQLCLSPQTDLTPLVCRPHSSLTEWWLLGWWSASKILNLLERHPF